MRRELEELKEKVRKISTAPSHATDSIGELKEIFIIMIKLLDQALPIDKSDDD